MSQLAQLKKELETVMNNGNISKLSDMDKKTVLNQVTLAKTMISDILKTMNS